MAGLEESQFTTLLQALHVSEEPRWPDEFGNALRRWIEQTRQPRVRALSLFTGAGGLDIGFHDAGFDIVSMVEIDPKFVASLKANIGSERYFQDAQLICADIVDFQPSSDLNVDLVVGGPPCQPFSAAGRRAAGAPGLNDPRADLFKEFIRIVSAVQPKAFVFENVYGLTGVQAGQAWRSVLRAFEGLGYRISSRILDAADYGVPQHRERLILVGVRGTQYLFPEPTHGPDSPNQHPYYTPEEALFGLEEEEKPMPIGGKWGHLLNDIPPGLNYSFYTSRMGHPQPLFAWRSKFSDFLYKADPHSPIRAIKATGGLYTGPFHWDNRPFSSAELQRLQTIPDEFELVGGRQLSIKQIGNSVPPQLARMLALSLLNQAWGVEMPAKLELLAPNASLKFRSRKVALTELYRKKASAALTHLGESTPAADKSLGHRRRYRANIAMQSFDWRAEAEGDSQLLVEVEPKGGVLWINVKELIHAYLNAGEGNGCEITIVPSKLGWDIPLNQISLLGQPLSATVFVSLWKALEHHLAFANLKADLVQLSGYYQYPPLFTAGMSVSGSSSSDTLWEIVKKVVEGVGVRQTLHVEALASQWEVPTELAITGLKQLRMLGYEVRGHSTNVSIPERHFLIPYCFPTLNPRSVQLRKHLEV
ncbi:MAG: DNA cytosine methyltransferase [Chloroflexi bacterium]|nr:DNA cytosine methyltransferase [Chloroflexota bacterium]